MFKVKHIFFKIKLQILHLDSDPATQINADPRGFGFATRFFMAGSLLSKESEHVSLGSEITDL
jgi:hypothetical protein